MGESRRLIGPRICECQGQRVSYSTNRHRTVRPGGEGRDSENEMRSRVQDETRSRANPTSSRRARKTMLRDVPQPPVQIRFQGGTASVGERGGMPLAYRTTLRPLNRAACEATIGSARGSDPSWRAGCDVPVDMSGKNRNLWKPVLARRTAQIAGPRPRCFPPATRPPSRCNPTATVKHLFLSRNRIRWLARPSSRE